MKSSNEIIQFVFFFLFVGDTKFHSLPYRKKKTKPLNRSVSDASQKKLKKPSIFNLFSKRSDPNLTQTSDHDNRVQPLPLKSAIVGGRGSSGGGNTEPPSAAAKSKDSAVSKLVRRSKSDVGYKSTNNNYNDDNNNTNNSSNSVKNAKTLIIDRKQLNQLDHDDKFKKKSQLSPIIENQLQEKYFGYSPSEQKQRPEFGGGGLRQREIRSEERDVEDSGHTRWPSIRAYNSHDSVDLSSRTPQLPSISTRPLGYSLDSLQLHSSQLPPEKLPLTRGLAVDGMVKRLSMERFSPPPQLNSSGFSYIRPNEPTMYAQVRRDDTNAPPSAIGVDRSGDDGVDATSRTRSTDRSASLLRNRNCGTVDRGGTAATAAPAKAVRATRTIKPTSDRLPVDDFDDDDGDEGLDALESLHTRPYHRHISVEPPIIPRLHATPAHDESPQLQDLSNRRRLLESKFQSRSFSQPPEARERPIVVDRSVQQPSFTSPERTTTSRMPATSTPRRQWFQPPQGHTFDLSKDNTRDTSYSSRYERTPVRERELKHPVYIEDDAEVDYPPAMAHVEHTGRHRANSNQRWHDVSAQQFHDEHEPYRQPLRTTREPQPFTATVNRDKYKYRTFDKVDLGIENDLRRDGEFNRNIDRYFSRTNQKLSGI